MPFFLHLYVVMQLLLGAPLDALVDREHPLPPWYDPGTKAEALAAWGHLQQATEAQGLKVVLFSGYRAYEYQAQVLARGRGEGSERADRYLAPPGHSEHQLGTAFDVAWPGVPLGRRDPRNQRLYAWLEENAHRHGFVISYPLKEGDEWPFSNRFMPFVTEYMYEPWHIRYVGISLAHEIHAAGYLDPESPVLPQDFFKPWP